MNQIILKINDDGGSINDSMVIGDLIKKLGDNWEVIVEINSPGSTMKVAPTPKRITTPSMIYIKY